MAIENDNDEVVLTYSESYYEECASEEEIYLEEIEEELRSTLISDTPQDDCAQPGDSSQGIDTAFESFRKALANLFKE